MYEKLTFTNSTVLSASHCNQLEENVLMTRTMDISSTAPNSAELLAGNRWIDSTNGEWDVNVLQNSLGWLPIALVDTANSLACHHNMQICNADDGGPYVSSLGLDVVSLSSINSFFSVGPTASGSYDIVWSALDEIPRSLDFVLLKATSSIVTSANDADAQLALYAKTWQSSYGNLDTDVLVYRSGITESAQNSIHGIADIAYFPVKVNSDNAFDLARQSVSSFSGALYLIGYGNSR